MKSIVCATCAMLAIASSAIADTTMDFDGQGSEQPQQILISNGKVMMRSADGEDMLYDDRLKRLSIIVHDERSHFALDPEAMSEGRQSMEASARQQMRELRDELGPAMQEMRKNMQAMLADPSIPPAQKRMIEQQLAAMDAPADTPGDAAGAPEPQSTRVEATGEKRKVAGVGCVVHRVSEGSRAVEEVCVASRADLAMPEEDYRTMRAMFAFMRDLAERATGLDGSHMMPVFDGVPVQFKDLEDGGVSTLRAISTRRIDAGALTVPSDYRERNPFE